VLALPSRPVPRSRAEVEPEWNEDPAFLGHRFLGDLVRGNRERPCSPRAPGQDRRLRFLVVGTAAGLPFTSLYA